MSDVVIRCEGLSKQYRIGAKQEPYRTLRDSLANAAIAPFRMFTRNGNGSNGNGRDTIWALKDVSFEVKRGEVVGIIGRNGAGKSTLLKILSRITEPTEGRAMLKGRIAALLEVGTGFNPELTGRENIYLNAAILGMKKAEIDRKFDEIVAFAEVEKFIDTPVKHYSSGMHLRLGFAVAAHLEPEILVVDEVLAVGDAEFQKKCLGKMGDVAKQGRTILFVSHNMGAIQALCSQTVLLNHGALEHLGPTPEVVTAYLQMGRSGCLVGGLRMEKEDPRFQVVSVSWGPVGTNGQTAECIAGSSAEFGVTICAHETIPNMKLGVLLSDPQTGALVAGIWSQEREGKLLTLDAGRNVVRLVLPELSLRPSYLDVTVHVVEHTRGIKAIVQVSDPFVVLPSSPLEASDGTRTWLGAARLIPQIETRH